MAAFPSNSSESPLRVAVFSDSALPVLNGVSISVDALIRSLRDRGHSVHLWTSRFPGHRDSDPDTHRFLGAFTPFAKDFPLALPPFYPWFREFKDLNFDIVHTHTPFTVGFVGLRWAESCGVPVVSTYHTHYDRYAHYLPIFPRSYIRFKIAKHTNYYYNRVKECITPSQASRRWLQRHRVHTPVTVIPTGITPPRLVVRTEAREKLGFSPDHIVALYVGRLAREKNLDVMLESAAMAMEKEPRLRLVLVGEGPLREGVSELARGLGIGGKVRIEGAKPRAEVDLYYGAADVFLFCSITETQGLVVLEAMSHGLPAVLVGGGGASDPVTHGVNGLISANDPLKVSAALIECVASPEKMHALSVNARASARGCTVDAMTDAVVAVYRRAISGYSMEAPVREAPAR